MGVLFYNPEQEETDSRKVENRTTPAGDINIIVIIPRRDEHMHHTYQTKSNIGAEKLFSQHISFLHCFYSKYKIVF